MSRPVCKANPKHKRGAAGEGPPRWFPDSESLCPDDMDADTCQKVLDDSIEGKDLGHPHARARYAMFQGNFFKPYPEEGGDGTDECGTVALWHGYPVARSRVPRQVPARVLRHFRDVGLLTAPEY